MSIENLINEMEDMLENSWGLPMSGGRVVLNSKNIRKILEDIRLALPQEIVQAQKIINERNRIIEGAKSDAETMIKLSEEKIKVMVSQSEIVKAAQASADEILNDAQTKAKEIKKSASEYAGEMMKRMDESVTQGLLEIRKARQALETGHEQAE
ncbi:MAG: ATPase [Clostridia bacterium]|nr:ATPase [Clostridia bacterium]